MSPQSEEDTRLTQFLQQHRPTVPPASAHLEDRIMATLLDTPAAIAATPPRRQPAYRRLLWVVPSTIAAGLVAIVGYQTIWPTHPSEAELAELETFIESTWQGTLAEQPTTEAEELYPLVDEAGVN